jgi:hypothetical protein
MNLSVAISISTISCDESEAKEHCCSDLSEVQPSCQYAPEQASINILSEAFRKPSVLD